ncbi:MAG: hypothetical protein IH935_10635 [Acidobacteria bacterium]|nr:hypothetical protein [Acidobacteriota bacterium]
MLLEILRESGLVEMSGDSLRPAKDEGEIEKKAPVQDRQDKSVTRSNEISHSGLRAIPIPVSASSIWYVEVPENPEEAEIEKFLEMQRLIFVKK